MQIQHTPDKGKREAMNTPNLPLQGPHDLFMCKNKECFYEGSLMGSEEVLWRYKWDYRNEELALAPRCVSCRYWMEEWDGIQTTLPVI